MKKTYEKPGLYVENFALSQSIAMSCDFNKIDSTVGRPTHGDKTSCGWKDPDGFVTWTTADTCTQALDPNFDLGVGCYNGPTAGFQLFAS